GSTFWSFGEGEDNPVASNENVSGRSRNRRVDIHFIPKFHLPVPPKPKCPKEPCKEGPKKSFCEEHPNIPILCKGFDCTGSIFEAAICLITACLLDPVSVLCKCLEMPELCFCLTFPSLCDPTSKSKNKKKPPKPCIVDVNLPGGNLPMYEEWPILVLKKAFRMGLVFEDNPEKGCVCHCGEYKQNVRGYFEKEYENGTVKRFPKLLTPGVWLEEKTFHEDGNGAADSEYGHRSHPPLVDNGKGRPDDYFIPDQANGCRYKGNDNPIMGNGIAQEADHEVRWTMFLEFEGGPVDTCTVPGVRTEMRSHWHQWAVKGEIKKPPPAKGPGHGPGPGGKDPTNNPGMHKRVRVTGHAINATRGKGHGWSYGGGISPAAKVNDEYNMDMDFSVDGRDEIFTYRVHVKVIDADDNSITVMTGNDGQLNIAPPHTPPLILWPHGKVILKRNIL
ncbi:MAG TPA: hypothetical protein VLD19_19425, partial [Chitinophagaceae bacterium]|nr:hypothetical protein [Chitinophagaceae bacterium]